MRHIYFGPFELRPGERCLLKHGERVEIGARAFDLLTTLIRERHRVIGKDELLDLVWPGADVVENNLEVQIYALRQVLGTNSVATVRRRGYQFACALKGDGAALHSGLESSPASEPRYRQPPRAAHRMLGRDTEFKEICSVLDGYPLTSIVGPAGIGKTRLALALVDHVRAQLGRKVAWADLSALMRDDQVVPEVAAACGIHLAVTPPTGENLIRALGGSTLMLVLDNCEHVLRGVAEVVALLYEAGVPVLCTTQQPLALAAERLFRLGGLSSASSDDLARDAPAVALFVERAVQRDVSRCDLEKQTGVVQKLCAQLDGVPLALELAAAHVPLLGVAGVSAQLDAGLQLSQAAGSPGRPSHQALRTALDWSYGLLTGNEQLLLDATGVFAGGFSLALAEAMVQSRIPVVPRIGTVLELLGSLVHKSLVIADGNGVRAFRYRLLQSTRAYALRRLQAAGRELTTRHAHAIGLLQVLKAQESLTTDELAAEIDNLRSAVVHLAGPDGDPALLIGLLAVSGRVWEAANQQAEGCSHCLEAMTRVAAALSVSPNAVDFWLTLTQLGLTSIDPRCLDAGSKAAALLEAHGNATAAAEALLSATVIAARQRRHAEATRTLQRAADLLGPEPSMALKRRLVATRRLCAFISGDMLHARALAQEHVTLCQHGGDGVRALLAIGTVGSAELWLGLTEDAERNLLEAVGGLAELEVDFAGHLHFDLMILRMQQGRLLEALLYAREAYFRLQRESHQDLLLEHLAWLNALLGRYQTAAQVLGYAKAAGLEGDRAHPAVGGAEARSAAQQLVEATLTPVEFAVAQAQGRTMPARRLFELAISASPG